MTANGFDRHLMGEILERVYTYDKRKIHHLIKNSEKESFYNRQYFDLIERNIVYPLGKDYKDEL